MEMESLRKDMEDALTAIASMIERGEKAQASFAQGTAQHTLQRNRIRALRVASALIKREMDAREAAEDGEARGDSVGDFSIEDMKKAIAPIASLIHKSEKARQKLVTGSWQHAMLGRNLRALGIALPLVERAAGGQRSGRMKDVKKMNRHKG